MLRGEEMPLTSNFPGWEKQIAGTKKPALGGLGFVQKEWIRQQQFLSQTGCHTRQQSSGDRRKR